MDDEDEGGDDWGFFDDGSTAVYDSTDSSGWDFGDLTGTDGLGSDSGIDDGGTFQDDGSQDIQTAFDDGAVDTGQDDSLGNPIVENPDGSFTTFDAGTGDPLANYDSSGNLIETFGDTAGTDATDTTTDPGTDGAATDDTFGFDPAGNPILVQYGDGLGNTIDITQDQSGNLIYSTYDSAGNLVSETDGNGNALDGGDSTTPANVGTGKASSGSGGASGSIPGGGSSSGGSSGAGSGNSSALQALQAQLQALANALAAAQRQNSGVPASTIGQLQSRAGIVNGQIANLGGTPSSLFPTTGANSFLSSLSGSTGTILLVGGLALAAILLTRRPAPAAQAA